MTIKKKTVLITGANGFVGAEAMHQLAMIGDYQVRVATRGRINIIPDSVKVFENLDLADERGWACALTGVDCVIHCAARVHVMNERSGNPLADFRKINVDGTLSLAQHAVAADVKRFIFLSSLKVNGEESQIGKPFSANDVPNPIDPYGVSKMEAELGLFELSKKTNLEIVVIRPPLVYGPGVKGNFLSMLRWLDYGLPLPFGITKNKRSLISLGNLIDFIEKCIVHPAARNQIFLVSDGVDLSTSDLLIRIGSALGKRCIFLPIPPAIFNIVVSGMGKKRISQRLFCSLQADISKNKHMLNWEPSSDMRRELKKTIDFFLSN